MKLESGLTVALYPESNEALLPVALSEGVEKLNDIYLPLNKWRHPTKPETQLLTDNANPCEASSITHLRIPPDIIERLRQRIFSEIITTEVISSEKRQQALNSIIQELAKKIKLFTELRITEYRSADVQLTPPGKRSTAFNFKKKHYVGLHLDNHDRLKISERENGFQVLGINLGNSNRYLNFLNLSVIQIAEKLQEKGSYMEHPAENISKLVSDFFNNFSDYKVIRMTLQPGEAYVATTQYAIHDGATTKGKNTDIALLISGKFDVCTQ